MADDFDVEAMLEEPYNRSDDRASSKDKSRKDRDRRKRSRDRDRKRSRSRSKDRRRHSSRERNGSRRSRSRDRDRRHSSRDKDRHRRRSKERSKSRDRTSRRHKSRSISPVRAQSPELTPEERDARTVFCMQLAARIRPKDLEEFFSAVGTVKDVRLILDNKSHRSKGIAYIEFRDVDSVPLAIALSGQKLLGVPIMVQPSHAERNRMASAQAAALKAAKDSGPMRLYVGSLHYNISEEMLKGIFEPFGRIDDIKLMKDHNTTRSAGYGFITYRNAEDAKKAMDQLNGFELAGRPMKVGTVTDRGGEESTNFDADEVDRMGFGLGATGRLQLMAKLAEGTGMQIPQAAANVLGSAGNPAVSQTNSAPPIATQCFMLSNMFDPAKETNPSWEVEVRDDVMEECNKHGGVLHIFVDRASASGNVYVKCPSVAAAVNSVNSLHGRYFAGKVITAAYVPTANYSSLFPDSTNAMQLLAPSGYRVQGGFN